MKGTQLKGELSSAYLRNVKIRSLSRHFKKLLKLRNVDLAAISSVGNKQAHEEQRKS